MRARDTTNFKGDFIMFKQMLAFSALALCLGVVACEDSAATGKKVETTTTTTTPEGTTEKTETVEKKTEVETDKEGVDPAAKLDETK